MVGAIMLHVQSKFAAVNFSYISYQKYRDSWKKWLHKSNQRKFP